MKEFFQIPRETIKLESSNFYSRMILTSRCLCKGLSNLQKECKNHQNKPIFNLYHCVFDLSLEICINHNHSCQQHLKCLIYRRSLNVSNEYFMCRNNNQNYLIWSYRFVRVNSNLLTTTVWVLLCMQFKMFSFNTRIQQGKRLRVISGML